MRGNGHQKKTVKMWLMAGTCLAMISIIVFCFPKTALCVSQNDHDTEAVMQAAQDYLEAEVRKDYPTVYACFAPSSVYAQTNTYEQYLAEARSAQENVVKYRIIDITYIKKNESKLTYSTVEKIAQVEVEVTFSHAVTKHQTEVNIGFIFLKEGGKWYKS
jgi:predicted RNase H-like HicB family nuclease